MRVTRAAGKRWLIALLYRSQWPRFRYEVNSYLFSSRQMNLTPFNLYIQTRTRSSTQTRPSKHLFYKYLIRHNITLYVAQNKEGKDSNSIYYSRRWHHFYLLFHSFVIASVPSRQRVYYIYSALNRSAVFLLRLVIVNIFLFSSLWLLSPKWLPLNWFLWLYNRLPHRLV